MVSGGAGGPHPFGHGLAEVLHPVSHLSLAAGAQLQAGPVGEDDLEGVGPVRGAGSILGSVAWGLTGLSPAWAEDSVPASTSQNEGRGPRDSAGHGEVSPAPPAVLVK